MENIFKNIPSGLPDELIEKIAGNAEKEITIERIISRGHASAQDFWYDQDRNEFVILLRGKAALLFKKGNTLIEMEPGDYINIPSHTLHRVEWTLSEENSVWLAVFY